jgi:transcription elongation factor Elf1
MSEKTELKTSVSDHNVITCPHCENEVWENWEVGKAGEETEAFCFECERQYIVEWNFDGEPPVYGVDSQYVEY